MALTQTIPLVSKEYLAIFENLSHRICTDTSNIAFANSVTNRAVKEFVHSNKEVIPSIRDFDGWPKWGEASLAGLANALKAMYLSGCVLAMSIHYDSRKKALQIS